VCVSDSDALFRHPSVFAAFVSSELDHDERHRISNAEAHMNTALVFVAQKYSNIVLGTGLKQFHHFYWIEGEDGDPLTKRREIIPYSGRVSRTLIDRGYSEVRESTVCESESLVETISISY
jgi:hypothetical protein